MIRLTKLADYGVVILAQFAREPGELHSARQLADETSVPLPTVSKLLKRLVGEGLLESHRGATGGYRLSRAPDKISMAQIIEALDGPLQLTECDGGQCTIEHNCNVRFHWQALNRAIHRALSEVYLSELAGPPMPAFVNLPARSPMPLAARGR